MPRAVDPPGLFPAADLDPASKNLYLDWTTFPKFRWLDWLELEMLKQCFQNLINGMLAIQWLPLVAAGVRQAISVVTQFVICLAYWAMKVVQNLTKIGRDQYGWFFTAIFAKFEIPLITSVLTDFCQTWWGIRWLQAPIASMITAWSALVQLVQGAVRWLLKVIENILGMSAPGFFEIEMLKAAWANFVTRWNAINWTIWTAAPNFREALQAVLQLGRDLVAWARKVFQNLTGIDMGKALEGFAIAQLQACFGRFTDTWWSLNWTQPAVALRTAITAVADLLRCLVDWGITVVRNLSNIDLRELFSAFQFEDLRALMGAFGDTVEGINWLSAGALMTFIGAVITLSQGIGNWLLMVLNKILNADTGVIRYMFASVTNFIDSIVKYFWSDTAPWHAALDLLAGISGANPLQAVTNVFRQLQDLLSALNLPSLAALTGWLGGIGDAITNISNIVNSITGGVTDLVATIQQTVRDMLTGAGASSILNLIQIPIGNLTNKIIDLLEGIGSFPTLASIATNPYWIWDLIGGIGTARIDADATIRALRSVLMSVTAGTEISPSVSLRWQNLSYVATSPMRLQLIPYSAGSELAPVTVADVASPAAASDWLTIAATWIVPAGVDQIRMRLFVADTALAGRIWWRDASLSRSGGILMDWVSGLTDKIQETIDTAQQFVDDLINKIWSVFTGLPLPTIPKSLEELATAIRANLQNTIDNINAVINRVWSAFTGLPLPSIPKTVEELRTAIETYVGNISTTISNVQTQLQNVVAQAIQAVRDMLTGIANATTTQFNNWLSAVLTTTSSLNALNLINTINIARIPVTSLTRSNVPDLGTAITALINDGTHGVMTRRATATQSLPSNIGPQITGSFFDRLDTQGSGITGTLASSMFRVTIPGLYRCDICYKIQPTVSAIWQIAPALFKNGAVFRVGQDGIAFNYLTVGISVRWIKSSFEIPLAANDYVQAGYQAANATGTISSVLTGEAGGTESYFTVSLVSANVA